MLSFTHFLNQDHSSSGEVSPSEAQWTTPAPESVGENFYNVVCNTAKGIKEQDPLR
jgi:hypothetical protein